MIAKRSASTACKPSSSYAKELKPNASSQGFINVPIRERQGEYMVVRPASVIAIRVEPLFAGSVERY